MERQNIIKENALISEFMELEVLKYPYLGSVMPRTDAEMSEFISIVYREMEDEEWYTAPKFHASWDWLMPVVRKCNEINSSQLSHYVSLSMFKTANIDTVFTAVINFIKWHKHVSGV